MSRPPSSLEAIFAVPLGTARIPQPDRLNLALAAGLSPLATDAQRDAAQPADPFCFRSREEVFEWQGEPLSYLKREMLAATCETALAASSYTDEQFNTLGIQAKARFVIVRDTWWSDGSDFDWLEECRAKKESSKNDSDLTQR